MTAPYTPLRHLVACNAHVLLDSTPDDYRFKYIDISQVDSLGNVDVDGADWVTFSESPSRARRLAPPNSTIISTVRTYLRAIGSVPTVNDPLIFSTGFAVLEAHKIDPRYLTYACLSTPFVEEVVARSTGVSYPAINSGELLSIAIPTPTLQEQRRIADFLDDRVARIDQIIAARQSLLDLLAEHYRSQLDARLDWLADRQGLVTLRRLGMSIQQGWSPEVSTAIAIATEPGVLKLGAVRDGVFDPDQNKLMPVEVVPRGDLELHDGDLLITRANTPTLVGDCAVVVNCPPQRYLSDLIYRVDIPHFSHAAASAAIRGSRVKQFIGVLARGASSSMPKLRGDDIAEFPVPALTSQEQDELASFDLRLREQRHDRQQLLSTSITRLQEYKQSLITAAVTGEFDVTTASTRIPE